MAVDLTASVTGAAGGGNPVAGAIRDAAGTTGASFRYLLATARIESNLNPAAAAPTSSARGLFQFIEQTWLATMKESGASQGYGAYANAITRSSSGRYSVDDPQMRATILNLRRDPAANAAMAGVFTQKNAATLKAKLGRPATEAELYMAHFLGASGASRLINAAQSGRGASAAEIFPGAARANRSIFFDRTGNSRSASDVYGVLANKYAGAVGRNEPMLASATRPADAVRAIQPVANAPDTAGTTQVYAGISPTTRASDGEIFHSLFQEGARRQPVARGIQELWLNPSAASAPAAEQPASGGMVTVMLPSFAAR